MNFEPRPVTRPTATIFHWIIMTQHKFYFSFLKSLWKFSKPGDILTGTSVAPHAAFHYLSFLSRSLSVGMCPKWWKATGRHISYLIIFYNTQPLVERASFTNDASYFGCGTLHQLPHSARSPTQFRGIGEMSLQHTSSHCRLSPLRLTSLLVWIAQLPLSSRPSPSVSNDYKLPFSCIHPQ